MISGKTIIILGAGGRIGSALTQSVLSTGAKVVAVDQDSGSLSRLREATNHSPALLAMLGDATEATSIDAIFETAEREFGVVDGALNTAYPRNKNYGADFLKVTYEDFCENVSLHLGSYFLFMQSCIRYSQKSQLPFSLVNMSSVYGSIPPKFDIYEGTDMTMPVEYAAIKSGLEHLSRYATSYARKSDFRVNCVSPGGILSGQDPSFLSRYNSHCGKKGMLDPSDIVGTLIFLLSDFSTYIRGQNIVVDDGFST